jgi:hypothetical protein
MPAMPTMPTTLDIHSNTYIPTLSTEVLLLKAAIKVFVKRSGLLSRCEAAVEMSRLLSRCRGRRRGVRGCCRDVEAAVEVFKRASWLGMQGIKSMISLLRLEHCDIM